MKKKCLIAIGLIAVLALSACGNTSGQLQEGNKDNTSSNDVTANTDNLPGTQKDSTNSVTEDFLKTITAETAEAKGACGNDLTWYYKDNVLVIKGTGAMPNYRYDTAPWCNYEDGELVDKINWVIIDEGITSIGGHAFYELHVVSKIALPNTMERIEDEAFYYCEAMLEKLTIPASVTYIGDIVRVKELTFLGDAPEGSQHIVGDADKVYYSGNGFETSIEKHPNIEWIKQ